MTTITWKIDGQDDVIADVKDGINLMEAALDNGIVHIEGECGGTLTCSTCHVFVDPAWVEQTGEPDDAEDAMLDMTDVEREERSRLSCQIDVAPALDGLVLHVPVPD